MRFLLLKAVCSGNAYDLRLAWLVADQLLGNSVGAIESVACASIAFGVARAAAWGRFGVSLLGKLAPFGGSAAELRLLGLG